MRVESRNRVLSLLLSLLLILSSFSCATKSELINTTATNGAYPAYSGSAYVSVNGGVPSFSDSEKQTTQSFESYGELDSLGRCTTALACVGKDIMPTEKRGSIGGVKPTGWHTVRYDGLVDGNYLYNRCHLIAYELTGENANEKNLITGTRYMNVDGMLPNENKVADYVKDTGNHVMYRSTPVFTGDNLVADGVLLEGYSVEDSGSGICFCYYCYNVQPGIEIDYKTGDSHLTGESSTQSENSSMASQQSESGVSYIGNKSSKKFHSSDCTEVEKIKDNNKVALTDRESAIAQGYEPCGKCKP